MKDYTIIKVECFSHVALMEIYERKYQDDYDLIGYSHNTEKRIGELVLYKREVINK